MILGVCFIILIIFLVIYFFVKLKNKQNELEIKINDLSRDFKNIKKIIVEHIEDNDKRF